MMLHQLIIVSLLFQHQLQHFTCNPLSSNYTDSRLSSELASDDFSDIPFSYNSSLSYDSSVVYDESNSSDSQLSSELTSDDFPDLSSSYNSSLSYDSSVEYDDKNSSDSQLSSEFTASDDFSDLSSSYGSSLSYDSSLVYDESYSSDSVISVPSEATAPFAPTDPPQCTYPTGSIACKTWNQVNVDCARRSLTCIPHLLQATSVQLLDLERNNIKVLPDFSFIRFRNMISLYLGSNEIFFIGNDTFSGPYKLRHLDLQSNSLRTVSGSPFLGLIALETLHFRYGYDRYYLDSESKPLLTASFAGLTHLEELQLDIAYWSLIENVSFQELSMLDSVTITINYYEDSVITSFPSNVSGLFQLKNLRIYGYAFTEIDLCKLSALENLYLSIGYIYVSNTCYTSSLKAFAVDVWYHPKDTGFEKLHKVTNITVTLYNEQDVLEFLQAPKFLNSPLETLTYVYKRSFSVNFVFSPTYFKPLANFNSSLHELSLNAEMFDIELEGSPFNHFRKLIKLTIICNSLRSSYPDYVFEGLENLQELQFKCQYSSIADYFTHFSQPILLQSLKRIIFLSDKFETPNTLYVTDVWCNFPSLEYMELSHAIMDPSIDCVLPHLQTMIGRWTVDVNVCKVAPYLEKIDFSTTSFSLIPFVEQCPYLRFLNLSHARGFHSSDVTSDMPLLEELYLSDVYDGTNLAFDVLRGFRTPVLRYLDISYNSISVITKDDAKLLGNLTFLDLTGNALVSFDYVQYLVSIETLILKKNFFTTFPRALFDVSSIQLLNVLDLSGNQIVCDCSIKPFQSWMVTDLRVRLLRDPRPDAAVPRCSYCCASPDASEGLSVTEIDLDCKSQLWAYIVIGVISAVFLVIVGLLVALYHWNIKNRLFLLLNRRRDPVAYLGDADHDDEDENGIPRYDAYVSYCNEDEDWICDELDPTIEGGAEPLRLCIRGRDIPANRPILQSISLYMKRSRKVVLILSPRYIEDRGRNQCKFELALAHQRLQEENEHVLILILLEDIPDRQMTLMMRQLFNCVLCLKWPGDECGQGLFWQRLREELKRRVPVDEYYEAQIPQAMELQRMA